MTVLWQCFVKSKSAAAVGFIRCKVQKAVPANRDCYLFKHNSLKEGCLLRLALIVCWGHTSSSEEMLIRH
jgi:hypothetical protein